MENIKAMVLLIILGLFCCLHVSEAIRCYWCNSLYSAECEEKLKTMHTCYGDDNDTVCYRLRKPRTSQFVI